LHGKQKVAGSIPAIGSKICKKNKKKLYLTIKIKTKSVIVFVN